MRSIKGLFAASECEKCAISEQETCDTLFIPPLPPFKKNSFSVLSPHFFHFFTFCTFVLLYFTATVIFGEVGGKQ